VHPVGYFFMKNMFVCVCVCRQCMASHAAYNLKYTDHVVQALLHVLADKCNDFSLLLVQEVNENGGGGL
jgi:hypothetical protein